MTVLSLLSDLYIHRPIALYTSHKAPVIYTRGSHLPGAIQVSSAASQTMGQLSIITRPVVIHRSPGNDRTLDASPITSYYWPVVPSSFSVTILYSLCTHLNAVWHNSIVGG